MDLSFQENKDRFFNCLPHNHFIFELTKCCNYTEWITILKSYTISDLYRAVKHILGNQNIRLFVKDPYNNVLHLFESDLIIKQLISSNSTFFTPVYPLPYQVVYKIYVDDGHNHIH
jgi:hypothetical protein